MALVEFICPSKNCGQKQKATKGSTVGHKCRWNQNKMTYFVVVASDNA